MVKPIAPVLKANLLRLAEAYARATGVSLATVSRYVTNDNDTLGRLKEKPEASITLRKYDDAIKWFYNDKNWPAGLRRPRLVDPVHQRRAA